MMKILVIDGQGGGVGKTLITFIRQSGIAAELMAAGTNAIATSNMMKAGADAGASGESAVLYNISCCEKTDVIVGPVGIILGNALHGEVSPAIASAVSQSPAMKILVPSNKCSLYMAGVEQKPLTEYIADAVRKIAELVVRMSVLLIEKNYILRERH